MITKRRSLAMLAGLALLAGCKVIPSGGPSQPRPPADTDSSGLPSDANRHRVALLVPMTGPNAQVGQALANAATMAILDADARAIRLTTYDTAGGAGPAAARALADGSRLILGPLAAEEIAPVAAATQPRHVPVIAFANDDRPATGNPGHGVFVMGSLPAQSIARSVGHVSQQGARRFAALVPAGTYGQQASAALAASARARGGSVTAVETYDRARGSLAIAARRLRARGGFDAVLIADGPRLAAQAAPLLKASGAASPRIIGTELWSGDGSLMRVPALRGAVFSAVSDGRFAQFAASYRTRFGAAPPRIATLGYDAVLLTVRLSRQWKVGGYLSVDRLTEPDGFLGVDGAFRFKPSGSVERAFEVREIGSEAVRVVSTAPAAFGP